MIQRCGGRARPLLPERLAAQALGPAVDPAIPVRGAADTVASLARGDRAAVEAALRLVLARGTERPNRLVMGAADARRLALDGLADPVRS